MTRRRCCTVSHVVAMSRLSWLSSPDSRLRRFWTHSACPSLQRQYKPLARTFQSRTGKAADMVCNNLVGIVDGAYGTALPPIPPPKVMSTPIMSLCTTSTVFGRNNVALMWWIAPVLLVRPWRRSAIGQKRPWVHARARSASKLFCFTRRTYAARVSPIGSEPRTPSSGAASEKQPTAWDPRT